ncbi:MAG TPA: tetratricopeptide repeat-containing protein [Longimicrobium sp.]|nr:tetratricopeptide repeat-containing protein [Longimicrobium sp.]
MQRAFVIRPFETKQDSKRKKIDFTAIHDALIAPAIEKAKLAGGTTGQIIEAGNIREDMFSLILEGDVAICDVTIHNANVFYELGMRHALRKKHTILIRGEPSADKIPFDLLTDRYLVYDLAKPGEAVDRLVAMIQESLDTDRDTDSPIFRMMPGLEEADPERVQAVPPDFHEEVDRARAAESKGWLRLLADDVRGHRFQWPGLRLVAEAQRKVKDLEGARESLNAILEADPDDPGANHMLANVYERRYREDERKELLEASEQAIDRVLRSRTVDPKIRTDALAMRGRNQKTLWRLEFEKRDGPVEERRRTAMNRRLRDSYEAYRAAFYDDLNSFYPGLAALQMGVIFLELTSSADDASWKDSFNDVDEADQYRKKVAKQVETLRVLIPAALEAHRKHTPKDVWADISDADLLFLFEKSEDRIVRRYEDTVPRDDWGAWDAAKGQLQLFAALGFRADLAQKVIARIDARMQPREPGDDRPLHLVIFAGHRVDADGSPPRFPAAKVEDARRLIREKLEALGDTHRLETLASAAPGADILFHELCGELGIPGKLCLPMPMDVYASRTFDRQPAWKNRFLDLHDRLREAKRVLELSDQPGLPRWMNKEKANPWERGNRWVLQMAQTSGADRVTLIALWDGKATTEPGGTAHMVEIAEAAGSVRFEHIDSNQLLA